MTLELHPNDIQPTYVEHYRYSLQQNLEFHHMPDVVTSGEVMFPPLQMTRTMSSKTTWTSSNALRCCVMFDIRPTVIASQLSITITCTVVYMCCGSGHFILFVSFA